MFEKSITLAIRKVSPPYKVGKESPTDVILFPSKKILFSIDTPVNGLLPISCWSIVVRLLFSRYNLAVDHGKYFNVESDEVNDDDSGVESKSYVKVVDPVEVILNVPLYLLSLIIN